MVSCSDEAVVEVACTWPRTLTQERDEIGWFFQLVQPLVYMCRPPWDDYCPWSLAIALITKSDGTINDHMHQSPVIARSVNVRLQISKGSARTQDRYQR